MHPDVYRVATGESQMNSLPENWQDQRTPTGNTVLHVHVGTPPPNKGRVKGRVNPDFLTMVLKHAAGPTMLLQKNTNGNIPLHLAARFGHEDALDTLLTDRTLKVTNKKEDTALHEAARAGHVSFVKLMLQKARVDGGNVVADLLSMRNIYFETPLYLAAETGNNDLVDVILEHCASSHLMAKGPCGRTPLHAVIQWGTTGMAKNMLDKCGSLVRIKDGEGRTPIHSAAGDITKVKLLEVLLNYDDKRNSAVYIQDKKERTALHLAILQCNWGGIHKLMKSCPDSIEIVDDKGRNVVHYGAKLGCLCKFENVLSLGYFDMLINDKDKDGNTPLHLLAAVTPDVPLHRCFDRLEHFIRYSRLDSKAINNVNLTPGDILFSNKILSSHLLPRKSVSVAAPRGGRIQSYEGDYYDVEKASACRRLEKSVQTHKESAQNRLVVATLIATVSFAAGITLPGGFDQESGSAILTRQTAFNVFLVSDAIAFVCSSLAIISYFGLSHQNSLFLIEKYSVYGYFLNTASLGALMIAFTSGVYATVSRSPGIAITILAVSLFFFYHYGRLLIRNVKFAKSYFERCHTKNLDDSEDRRNVNATFFSTQTMRLPSLFTGSGFTRSGFTRM